MAATNRLVTAAPGKHRSADRVEHPVDVTDELIASLSEAVDIMRGDAAPSRIWQPPSAVDVRAIRRKIGLSQAAFGHRFGFSPAAVRDWEQGRRRPDPAARTLLLVIAHNPDAVEAALRDAKPAAA